MTQLILSLALAMAVAFMVSQTSIGAEARECHTLSSIRHDHVAAIRDSTTELLQRLEGGGKLTVIRSVYR